MIQTKKVGRIQKYMGVGAMRSVKVFYPLFLFILVGHRIISQHALQTNCINYYLL